MNIGETEAYGASLAANTSTADTVPNGEVWMVEFAGMGGPSNDALSVGIHDGSFIPIVASNQPNSAVVGTPGGGEGAKHFVVDGNKFDLGLKNYSSFEYTYYWTAKRIKADNVVSGKVSLSDEQTTSISLPNSRYKVLTVGAGISGGNGPRNDLRVGIDGGTEVFLCGSNVNNAPPVGGTRYYDGNNTVGGGTPSMIVDGNKHNLVIKNREGFTVEAYYCAVDMDNLP